MTSSILGSVLGSASSSASSVPLKCAKWSWYAAPELLGIRFLHLYFHLLIKQCFKSNTNLSCARSEWWYSGNIVVRHSHVIGHLWRTAFARFQGRRCLECWVSISHNFICLFVNSFVFLKQSCNCANCNERADISRRFTASCVAINCRFRRICRFFSTYFICTFVSVISEGLF